VPPVGGLVVAVVVVVRPTGGVLVVESGAELMSDFFGFVGCFSLAIFYMFSAQR